MRGEPEGRVVQSMVEEAGRKLVFLGLKLAVAESCTGGGLADVITDVAGSSGYFQGGIVSYSNRAKEKLLRVDPEVLERLGAVSEPVALQMAEGVRDALEAEVGLGITGIAGPGGGSDEKPVGLVYIGLSAAGRQEVRRFVWSGDRLSNKRRSLEAALEMLLDHLLIAGKRG